jgi:transposase-like protein
MALIELAKESGDGDFLRTGAQTIMEADAEELIGAGDHDRHTDRLNYHHG